MKDISNAQQEFHKYCREIIDNLTKEYDKEIDNASNMYTEVIEQINTERKKINTLKVSNSEMSMQLAEIKDELNDIQNEIFKKPEE